MASEWETVAPASDGWETVAPAKKATKAKFEAQPDTQYSAEGIPITNAGGPDELPAWAQKVERGITDVMGAPIRAAVSIAKPIAGVAEWLGYGEPGKAVKALDEGIKSRTGIVSSAGSLAGDIAGFGALGKGVQLGAKALQTVPKIADVGSKLSQLSSKILPQTGIGSTVAKGAGIGAATGLVEPTGKSVGEEGFAEEKAKQVGAGALFGAALPAAGAGVARVLNPRLERLKELSAAGYGKVEDLIKNPNLTLGQIMGGPAATFERVATALPFSGANKMLARGAEEAENLAKARMGKVSSEFVEPHQMPAYEAKVAKSAITEADKAAGDARLAKLDDDLKAAEEAIHAEHGRAYSTPIIKEAIEPLGIKVPENLHGNQLIDFATTELSKGYGDVYKQMGSIPFSAAMKKDFQGMASKIRLTPEAKLSLEAEVDALANTTSKNQKLTPEDWHRAYSDLGETIYKLKTTPGSPFSKPYINALQTLRDKWAGLAKDRPGFEQFEKLQQASSQLQAPIKAAGTLKAVAEQGGTFDPKQFLAALKQDSTTKQFARGAVKREEEAVAAHQAYVEALKAHKGTAAAKREAAKEELRQAKLARDLELAHPEHPINQTRLQKEANLKEAEAAKLAPTQHMLKELKKSQDPGYDLRRIGYALGLGNIAYPLLQGLHAGAPMAGLAKTGAMLTSPYTAAAVFGPGAATRLGYMNPKMQQIWKQLATQRSPQTIAAGKELERRIAAGLDMPTSAAAIAGGKGALMPSESEYEAPEEEYASGGLVYLANGGAAKKPEEVGIVKAYRADVVGKYKSPDRLETLPRKYDKETLENFIKAMRAGEEFGVPQLSPQQIAKMAMVEGRSDLGFNMMNYNNPRAMQAATQLANYGHPGEAANFAGALIDKHQLAERKGIPFEHAWNGLGKSKYKQTGADYAKKYEGIDYAVEHPKNAPLMQFINEAYQYQTPKPNPTPFESTDVMGGQTGLGYLR